MTKVIGLNLRGRSEPDIYRVCEDVFDIVRKMLHANQVLGQFSQHPLFEFEEVPFVLGLLGAVISECDTYDYSGVDLWISEG